MGTVSERIRRGLTVPIFGELADPAVLAVLASEAEQAGLDGFFVWDHLTYRAPVDAVTDPWISLAAIALATSTVAIGPMVTPLARRRPAVVARQVTALDHLSNGRVVLGTGLGLDTSGGEFAPFGEEPELRTRAAMYDEALELLRGLLSGEPVSHHGDRFQVPDGVRFTPTPLQDRLPIWVACRWPNRKPLERAARQDGVFVIDIEPTKLPEVVTAIRAHRGGDLSNYDVVVHAQADADVLPWVDAGATWCLTTFNPFEVTVSEVRRAIDHLGGARK
jgi:alkanesulfonate monooxygenase SsuD/methylene tetrahydromethanopterin reductase-like flavin-dependent oxidoreductase (luciferase family)